MRNLNYLFAFLLLIGLSTTAQEAAENQVPEVPKGLADDGLVLAEQITWEKDNSQMVLIPAGSFEMGDHLDGMSASLPVHTVELDGFYMDVNEVTVGQFREFVNQSGYSYDPVDWRGNKVGWEEVANYSPGDEYPIVLVNWNDATAYAKWAGKRLPTEAEWEYASRGAAGNTYPWGIDEPTSINSRHGGGQGPNPIDHHASGASENGVLNLAGNVSEWVSDWWDPTFYRHSRGRNPNGPIDGDYKVVRGGSWADTDFDLRSAARSFHTPNRGAAYIGFRCARSSKPNS